MDGETDSLVNGSKKISQKSFLVKAFLKIQTYLKRDFCSVMI